MIDICSIKHQGNGESVAAFGVGKDAQRIFNSQEINMIEEQPNQSKPIAFQLSEPAYDQYADGAQTRLAKATTEYFVALELAAQDYAQMHEGLNPTDFMLAYHDNLSN